MAPKPCPHCKEPLTQVIVEQEYGWSDEPWESWVLDGMHGIKCGHCGKDVYSWVNISGSGSDISDIDFNEEEEC